MSSIDTGVHLMAWILLVVAGALEIVWAVRLKDISFTKLGPSIGTLAAMAASMYLLFRATLSIPVGTAYAVWTGIGASGTAIIGMLFLGESRDVRRIACIVLIVVGTLGLRFLEGSAKA